MIGGGEEEVWLAQGEALGDPRPDVPHLLHGDNLRGEVVRIESQLHILPAESTEKDQDRALHVYKGRLKKWEKKR